MIYELQLVSLSDFILGIFCVFLAGLLLGNKPKQNSRYKMGSYFLLFAGLAAFVGGIDHGFFEPINQRYYPRTLSYICVAIANFALFRYSITTFFKKPLATFLYWIAFIQLVLFIVCSFYIHNFILVVANYTPTLLLFLLLNAIHFKKGKTEKLFVLFCVILILATLVQVLSIGLSEKINSDTLFHMIAFVAYLFYYFGAKKLKNAIE